MSSMAPKVCNVCVNCGYEEGVHRSETLQCPGDGQNSMKGGRLWRGTTYQTRATPLLTDAEAVALLNPEPDNPYSGDSKTCQCDYHKACRGELTKSDPGPSKTAEELINFIERDHINSLAHTFGKKARDRGFDYIRKLHLEKDFPCPMCDAIKGLQSALDSYAKAKVEEATKTKISPCDWCKNAKRKNIMTDPCFGCVGDCSWPGFEFSGKNAAILGREVGE